MGITNSSAFFHLLGKYPIRRQLLKINMIRIIAFLGNVLIEITGIKPWPGLFLVLRLLISSLFFFPKFYIPLEVVLLIQVILKTHEYCHLLHYSLSVLSHLFYQRTFSLSSQQRLQFMGPCQFYPCRWCLQWICYPFYLYTNRFRIFIFWLF